MAEAKQDTMLMPQKAMNRAAGGLELPRPVKNASKSTDGTKASATTRAEIFCFLPGSLSRNNAVEKCHRLGTDWW